MDYLLYVERAAEHLQFFLWFRGYIQRFDALNPNEKALSPEWTAQNQNDALAEWKKAQSQIHKRQPSNAATDVLKGTIFSKEADATVSGVGNPFVTPPPTSQGRRPSHATDDTSTTINGTNARGGTVTPWDSYATVKSPVGAPLHTNQDHQRSKETAASVARVAFDSAGLVQPCKSNDVSGYHSRS
jgi:hypothetical protein